VYDVDLIMSWTPKEYLSFLKGAQHKQIDQYEFMAKQAMAFRYAQNAKNANERKIFNAKQARFNLDNEGLSKNDADIQRNIELNKAFKGFKPEFIPKGG